MVTQLRGDGLGLVAARARALEHDEGADGFAGGVVRAADDRRFGDNLPKTRSGKIMRRLLRSVAKGEAITQDTSTLENPAILDQLSENN